MTAPAKYSAASLEPGSPKELKAALAALFETFSTREGDDAGMTAKVVGYLEVCRSQPAWAVHNAVRKFLHGKIQEHNGRFLPTAAELARAVRAETAWHRERAAAARRASETRALIDDTVEALTPEQIARRRSQVQKALASLDIETKTAKQRRDEIVAQHMDDPTYRRCREIAAAARERQRHDAQVRAQIPVMADKRQTH